jgi:hypothetical protein
MQGKGPSWRSHVSCAGGLVQAGWEEGGHMGMNSHTASCLTIMQSVLLQPAAAPAARVPRV